MATGGGQSSLPKLQCTICLEDFKRPKLLPCHHTFCAVCLEKYMNSKQFMGIFQCPLCRKDIKVPKKGVEEFQTNFYIDQTEKKQDQILCDACTDKSTADHRCLDCQENFCSRCTASHINMKISRHHKLLELSAADQDTKRKIKARVFCTKHESKEIEVICKQCDKLICLMCMLMDHRGHESRELKDEAREVRDSLRTSVKQTNVQELTKYKKEASAKLYAQKRRLNQTLENELHEVDSHCGKLLSAVEKGIKKRKAELKKEYTRVIEEVDRAMKSSGTYCNSVISLATTAESVIDQATDVAILEKGKKLCIQLDNERKQKPKLRNDLQVIDATIFTKGEIDVNALNQMIGSVAEIDTSEQHQLSRTLRSQVSPINNRVTLVSTVVATYAKGKPITGIAPISSGRAWVAYDQNTITLVDSSGKSLLEVNIRARCNSVTADNNDNCLVACYENNSIKHVTTAGKVEETGIDIKTKLFGNGPYGIAYMRNGNGSEKVLYISDDGYWSDGQVYVASYQTKVGPVTVFADGFIHLRGLAVDKGTGRVCVCEIGRYGINPSVTVLDDAGKKQAEYKPKDVRPHAASFDDQGCILVATDDSTKPLHRIKPDGSLVEILTNVRGRSVAVDCQNRIWVGGNNGKIDIYEVQ